MTEIIWTNDKIKEIKKVIQNFMNTYNPSCAEAVMQIEDIHDDSSAYMAEIIGIILNERKTL